MLNNVSPERIKTILNVVVWDERTRMNIMLVWSLLLSAHTHITKWKIKSFSFISLHVFLKKPYPHSFFLVLVFAKGTTTTEKIPQNTMENELGFSWPQYFVKSDTAELKSPTHFQNTFRLAYRAYFVSVRI